MPPSDSGFADRKKQADNFVTVSIIRRLKKDKDPNGALSCCFLLLIGFARYSQFIKPCMFNVKYPICIKILALFKFVIFQFWLRRSNHIHIRFDMIQTGNPHTICKLINILPPKLHNMAIHDNTSNTISPFQSEPSRINRPAMANILHKLIRIIEFKTTFLQMTMHASEKAAGGMGGS